MSLTVGRAAAACDGCMYELLEQRQLASISISTSVSKESAMMPPCAMTVVLSLLVDTDGGHFQYAMQAVFMQQIVA